MKKEYIYLTIYAIGLATVITFMEEYFYTNLLLRMLAPAIYAVSCPLIYNTVKEYKEKTDKNKKVNKTKILKIDNKEEKIKEKTKNISENRNVKENIQENSKEIVKDKPKTLVKKL